MHQGRSFLGVRRLSEGRVRGDEPSRRGKAMWQGPWVPEALSFPTDLDGEAHEGHWK